MAIRILTNVAPDDVEGVKQIMTDSGAISVTATLEPDGEFTVMGVFPDVERHTELRERLQLKPGLQIE